MTDTINKIMEQAQVFASAWSLVGGPFDFGDGLEDAEQAKAELKKMLKAELAALQAQPVPPPDLSRLEPFVHGLGKAILRELIEDSAPVQPVPPPLSMSMFASKADYEAALKGKP